jgi:enterochelin esterase-like enzyme
MSALTYLQTSGRTTMSRRSFRLAQLENVLFLCSLVVVSSTDIWKPLKWHIKACFLTSHKSSTRCKQLHSFDKAAVSSARTSPKLNEISNEANRGYMEQNIYCVPPFPDGSLCRGWTSISLSAEILFPSFDVNRLIADEMLDALSSAAHPWLLPPRRITVWLPPNYNDCSKHAVLYCLDGQNAVVDSDSWTGRSWRLVGALQRLHEQNLLQQPLLPIVVLVPSIDKELMPGIRRRHLEYGDCSLETSVFGSITSFISSGAMSLSTPFAKAHIEFMVHKLKPYVDSRFCTEPADSYLIGTSMGGQAALRVLIRYPNLFRGVACLSPFFGSTILHEASLMQQQWKTKLVNDKLNHYSEFASGKNFMPHRIYLDIGGDMDSKRVPVVDVEDHLTSKHWWNPGYWWLDTQLQTNVQKMFDTLQSSLYSTKSNVSSDSCCPLYDVVLHQYPGARHNERAWSQRIHIPLLYLFGQ